MKNSLLKYLIQDLFKNKILLYLFAFICFTSWTVLSLEGNSDKGSLSLLNVLLLVIPLFTLIFSNIYLYNSTEFMELLLSQPVKRNSIWNSMYLSLALSIGLVYIIGICIPLFLFVYFHIAITFLIMGLFLIFIFVGLAMLIFVLTKDKSIGIGFSILIWLLLTIIYDGFLLMILFQFADYPVEKPIMGLVCLNPIDIARIWIMMQLDSSALLGFTGALFKTFFGSILGKVICIFLLGFWVVIPYYISLIKFNKKDL